MLNLFWFHVTEQSCKLEPISERYEVVLNKMRPHTCTHAESIRSVHGFCGTYDTYKGARLLDKFYMDAPEAT